MKGSVLKGAILFAMLSVAIGPTTADGASSKRADRDLEARLRAHIEMLASDDFDGREPGTEGEAKTLRYLGKQWFDIGLVSGTNDPGNEWFAPVTLVSRKPAASNAQFSRKGRRVFVPASQIQVLTSGKRSLVRDAPLLFVGNGEATDYSRTELAGRVAVVLDGDGTDPERQSRLLAQGASAVITVLDGERTLEEVEARRDRQGYALADETLGGDLAAFITGTAMDSLLKGLGVSVQSLEAAAARPGFVPMPLDLTASLEATTQGTTIRTHNLIGKIPGRHPDAGAVLFLAHWDHFGECASPPAEDTICNGAIDNASGVAVLTEVARRLVKGPPLDRDVYFLATTGEELGLLGASAFADDPPVPTTRIVAAFNIDSDAIAPHGTPFAVVGRGMTGLDPQIEKVAKQEHFKLVGNDDANEYVRRQDGWALLQHDIPTVMVTTAYGDMDAMKTFYDTDYHRPSDDIAHLKHLGGAADDVKMLAALGRWFGDTRKVPAAPGN